MEPLQVFRPVGFSDVQLILCFVQLIFVISQLIFNYFQLIFQKID